MTVLVVGSAGKRVGTVGLLVLVEESIWASIAFSLWITSTVIEPYLLWDSHLTTVRKEDPLPVGGEIQGWLLRVLVHIELGIKTPFLGARRSPPPDAENAAHAQKKRKPPQTRSNRSSGVVLPMQRIRGQFTARVCDIARYGNG